MEKTRRRQKLNWRIVVGVLVAFVLGGAVGGLVEHQRALDDSNATSSDTSAAPVASNDWFGDQKPAACPTLQRWVADGAASYAARLSASTNWEASRATLVEKNAAVTADYRTLMQFANENGKAQLETLIAASEQLGAAMQTAPTAQAFQTSAQAVSTTAVNYNGSLLGAAAESCPKT